MLRVPLPAPVLAAALFATPAAQPPQAPPAQPLVLELRIFLGAEEVTSDTRVTVHRAGERSSPIAQTTARGSRLELTVQAGIYDAQAIREVDGKVANIRWAERLVVMPYPDEGGRHLEVVNFTNGFGALQIRAPKAAALPDVTLFKAGQHNRPAATRLDGPGYMLFVVPAGGYDVQVRSGAKAAWYSDVEVPADRTRLWLVPEPAP
jgi:hypothetical protein